MFIVDIAEVYLSGFVRNDVKLEEIQFQLWYFMLVNLLPHLSNLYLSHLNLYLPKIADFIGFFLF